MLDVHYRKCEEGSPGVYSSGHPEAGRSCRGPLLLMHSSSPPREVWRGLVGGTSGHSAVCGAAETLP